MTIFVDDLAIGKERLLYHDAQSLDRLSNRHGRREGGDHRFHPAPHAVPSDSADYGAKLRVGPAFSPAARCAASNLGSNATALAGESKVSTDRNGLLRFIGENIRGFLWPCRRISLTGNVDLDGASRFTVEEVGSSVI